MTIRTLMKRIAVLEQGRERSSDAEILAWGKTITDDELRAITGREPINPGLMRGWSDAELLRYLRPVINARREGGQ